MPQAVLESYCRQAHEASLSRTRHAGLHCKGAKHRALRAQLVAIPSITFFGKIDHRPAANARTTAIEARHAAGGCYLSLLRALSAAQAQETPP